MKNNLDKILEEFDNNKDIEELFFGENKSLYHSKNLVKTFITKSYQQGREDVLEEMNHLVEKKFPRGERLWCVECVKRIKKALITNLNK